MNSPHSADIMTVINHTFNHQIWHKLLFEMTLITLFGLILQGSWCVTFLTLIQLMAGQADSLCCLFIFAIFAIS